MERVADINCPYCNHQCAFPVAVDESVQPRRFIFCSRCEATSVAKVTVNIIVATAAFKIEGEEPVTREALP